MAPERPKARSPSAPAGYSGTPLPKKLGVDRGGRYFVDGAPDGFVADALAPGFAPETRVVPSLRGAPELDGAVLFTTTRRRLTDRFPRIARRLTPPGFIWIAWPKRASGVVTDLTEGVLRDVILPTGFVDTKVCAIDATWSGLRFVKRKDLR